MAQAGGTKQLQAAFISGIDGVDLSTATLVTESGNQLGTTVLTAGTNITITPGAGTLTIDAAGGGGVTSIIGDTGTAQTGALTLTGGSSGAVFDSSASNLTMSFDNVNLPVTTSSVGQITIGGQTVFHGFNPGGTASIFAGFGAGNFTMTGTENTAFGSSSLNSVDTGSHNTAIGSGVLDNVTSGLSNTAVGQGAGSGLISGNNNTLLGQGAGSAYAGSESNNIVIGSGALGTAAESDTIRIGEGQSQCFISGIQGVVVTGTAVLVSASDQLGVAASSKRFKQDIQPMGAASNAIHNLKPVTFAWNKQSSPGLKDAPSDRQFGLIAEDVAQVMPHLVNNDKDGKPFSVHYERLIPMLLNEIQNLQKRVAKLESK